MVTNIPWIAAFGWVRADTLTNTLTKAVLTTASKESMSSVNFHQGLVSPEERFAESLVCHARRKVCTAVSPEEDLADP